MSESALNILVLLIGSNPLPAFIVGKFLLKGRDLPKPDRIVLIHSGTSEQNKVGTTEFAREVKDLIVGKTGFPESAIEKFSVGSDARSFSKIEQAIKTGLQWSVNSGLKGVGAASATVGVHSVHFNITGGTKPMAVQAYAIAAAAHRNGLKSMFAKGVAVNAEDCTFYVSDVDPETRKLQCYTLPPRGTDPTGSLMGKPQSFPGKEDLRDAVSLKFEELAQLHSIRVKNPGSNELRVGRFIDLAKFASSALEEDGKGSLWKLCERVRKDELYNGELKSAKREKNPSNRDKKVELAKQRLLEGLETDASKGRDEWQNFCKKYNQSLGKLVVNEKYVGDAEVSRGMFVDFLTGKWLEEYMFSLVRKWFIASPRPDRECNVRLGIEIERDQRTSELDVVLLQGYELALFSCTTNSRIGDVKQKGFEAVFRAEEFGGEHAKVILVSNISDENHNDDPDRNVEGLKRDFETFEATRNVHFITHQDLVKAATKPENELEGLVKQWLI